VKVSETQQEKGSRAEEQGQPSKTQGVPAGLAAESYEFIARTMDMQQSLRHAFESLELKPETAAEDIQQMWRGSFDQVYNNLFAMFLRPIRLAGSPTDLLTVPLESITPDKLADGYLSWLKLVSETPARYMKAMSNAFRSTYQGGNAIQMDRDVTGQTGHATPANLLRNMVDEGAEAYVETFDRMVSFFSENQFTLPRQLLDSLHEVLANYPRQRRVARKYETLFHDTWEKSLSRLAAEIKKQPAPVAFKDFFKTYLKVFGDEFSRLMASSEFFEAQNSYSAITSDLTSAQRRFMQAQLDLFPALPVATKNETDALAQRLHSYKVRSDALERKVRVLEAKLNALAPARQPAEPDAPQPRRAEITRTAKIAPEPAEHPRALVLPVAGPLKTARKRVSPVSRRHAGA